MTQQELRTKARTLGSAEVARLTGLPGDVCSRWIAGGVNTTVEGKLREPLTTPAKG